MERTPLHLVDDRAGISRIPGWHLRFALPSRKRNFADYCRADQNHKGKSTFHRGHFKCKGVIFQISNCKQVTLNAKTSLEISIGNSQFFNRRHRNIFSRKRYNFSIQLSKSICIFCYLTMFLCFFFVLFFVLLSKSILSASQHWI